MNQAPAPASDKSEIQTQHSMLLADFIIYNLDNIMKDFDNFVSECIYTTPALSHGEIRDHMRDVLISISKDIDSLQSSDEQEKKSKGQKASSTENTNAHIHGRTRVEQGLSLVDLNAEYRWLRANILKSWLKNKKNVTRRDFDDMLRFNEAIDEMLSESVNRFNEIIEEARTTFLGILGHDIRNPLGAIGGMADILINSGDLDEQKYTLIHQIKKSALHIGAITDNLLELTRIQMGSTLTINKQRCDLNHICDDAVKETQNAYTNADIKLNIETDLKCDLDPMRMQQVMVNLLRNAIQHGEIEQPISVKGTISEKEIVLTVHNYGLPIPSHRIKRIFERYSLPDTNEPSRNLGLGLYIVQQIITAHNGTINVTSSKEKGTLFTISLPC